MPPFLYFPIAKGGTRTISHLPIAEGRSFDRLERCIYNCKLRNEKEKKINPSALIWLPNWQFKDKEALLKL
jgi:hypothetical protein